MMLLRCALDLGLRLRLLPGLARLPTLVGDERGQAATEYVIMTAYMLVAGLLATPFLMKFAPEMMNAFQIYVDGFYFVFSLPIP